MKAREFKIRWNANDLVFERGFIHKASGVAPVLNIKHGEEFLVREVLPDTVTISREELRIAIGKAKYYSDEVGVSLTPSDLADELFGPVAQAAKGRE